MAPAGRSDSSGIATARITRLLTDTAGSCAVALLWPADPLRQHKKRRRQQQQQNMRLDKHTVAGVHLLVCQLIGARLAGAAATFSLLLPAWLVS